jgi:Leucine-rich repeat (LRR) protein
MSLRKINAGHNYITQIKLSLPRLQELDLRHNYLITLPYLNMFPNLRILNVKANRIEEVNFNYLDRDPVTKEYDCKIEKLNLAANRITLKSKIEA